LPSSPPYGTIISNIWEDAPDIKEIDDAIRSLDDWSLCGDSIQNYVVKFAFDACKYYERGRETSPLYVTTLFKIQATHPYMHWISQIAAIYWYTKYQCIGRELDLKVNCFMLYVVILMLSCTI
jgi:hypothetical protein